MKDSLRNAVPKLSFRRPSHRIHVSTASVGAGGPGCTTAAPIDRPGSDRRPHWINYERRIMNKFAYLATVAFPLFATAAPAQTAPIQPSSAQSTTAAEQQPATDDIIVTAQRRDESLSKTPVAVAVLSSDTLAKANIVSEQDLRAATPGLTVRAGISSNQLNYSLRGQSQDAFANTRPGVLPYINEVQIGGVGGSSAFYDLQSVQVLKGPQGTLFGRSATGGAVLFTTAKPTDKFGGYISGLYGSYNAAKVEGAINVPLIADKLNARIAGIYQSRDGFQHNLYDGEREGNLKRYGVRGSLSADLGGVRNDLVIDYFNQDSQNTVGVISGLLPYTGAGAPFIPIEYLYAGTSSPIATATGTGTLQAFTGVPAATAAAYYNAYFSNPLHPAEGIRAYLAEQQARGPFVIDSDARNLYHTNNVIITNATTIDLSPNTILKNIFGYTHLKSFVAFEGDGTPYGISSNGAKGSNTGIGNTTRQISDELQLSGKTLGNRLSYVTGVYYSDERYDQDQYTTFFDLLFGGQQRTDRYVISNKTIAGYAQGTYKLNDDGLAATLGARYTSEQVGKLTKPLDSARAALGDPAPAGYDYDKSTTYNRLSWQIGLQDQVNPDLLFYAVSRRAYKSGGYNGQVPPKIGSASVAGDSYAAERVTDAELGAKFNGAIADMPTRFDVALFYNWVDNSQRAAFTLVGGSPAALTVNVPKGKIYGAEVDGQVRPAHWLTLGGAINYTHSGFSSEPVAVNGTLQVFDQVPDTPKYSGTIFADITVPLSGNLKGTVHGDLYAQNKVFTAPKSSNNYGTVLSGYALANFRIGVEDTVAGWSLTANLKNAFNHVYYVGGLPVGEIYQINTVIPGDPRTFTAEARFKF